MGAPAKREVRCAQCGSPAEDGFARQYCSNRSCAQYMPPLVGVTYEAAKVRTYRAICRGGAPASSLDNVWVDVWWPDGTEQACYVYGQARLHLESFERHSADYMTAKHSAWHGKVLSPGKGWCPGNPMYDAIRGALNSGEAEVVEVVEV